MSKEDFIERYRKWNDEKLIATFKKRNEYQPEAVEAMQVLMKERKLGELSEQIVKQDQAHQKQKEKLEKEQDEYNRLGSVTDDIEFAKQKRNANGFYFQTEVVPVLGKAIRMAVFLPLVVCGMFFFLCTFDRPLFHYSEIIFGGLTAIFAGLLIYSFFISANAATITLAENASRKTVFSVMQGDYSFTAQVPFRYEANHVIIETRTKFGKLKQPMLRLIIFDSSGTAVTLTEMLSFSSVAPPDWPRKENYYLPKGSKGFGLPFGQKNVIFPLKKILDGLHQMQK